MIWLLPVILYAAKDAIEKRAAAAHYGAIIAEREGVELPEGGSLKAKVERWKAIAPYAKKAQTAAGGASELAMLRRSERMVERSIEEQSQVFEAQSRIYGRDPAIAAANAEADLKALPMVTRADLAAGGVRPADVQPATQAPDPFLPALVVAGLWYWSKRRK
jgi:hypothetical protein